MFISSCTASILAVVHMLVKTKMLQQIKYFWPEWLKIHKKFSTLLLPGLYEKNLLKLGRLLCFLSSVIVLSPQALLH